MRVTTSDGKALDNFERIQAVVKQVQDTKIMQDVAKREGNGQVRYNGRSIGVGAYKDLKEQIPGLLRDMKQCSMQGKIYSGSSAVFEEKFATFLNFLLAWLGCMNSKAGVDGLVIKDAFKWLDLVVTRMRYQSDDVNYIKNMINQL
jgi:hypothetical protein